MSVWNYSGALVYEIFTNQGSLYVRQDKYSGKVDVVDVKNTLLSDSVVVVPVRKLAVEKVRDIE